MLGVVFLFRLSKKTEYLCSVWFFIQSIFADQNNSFQQIFFTLLKISTWVQIQKIFFTADHLLLSFGGFKIAKVAMFSTKLCALWKVCS